MTGFGYGNLLDLLGCFVTLSLLSVGGEKALSRRAERGWKTSGRAPTFENSCPSSGAVTSTHTLFGRLVPVDEATRTVIGGKKLPGAMRGAGPRWPKRRGSRPSARCRRQRWLRLRRLLSGANDTPFTCGF